MSDAPSRIEGASGVHSAARLANQRMLEMLAERMGSGNDRADTEKQNALDQLRKDIDDTLRAASKAAGSARTVDPSSVAADPTTLPTAAKGSGNGGGVLAQLDPVLQQAALLLQQGESATQQLAASALLNSLANQAGHAQPFAAASGSPVLTAGDNGGNAGGGFMPGNQPWLQLPESFSTRSTLPDVATKSNADGSLRQSSGDGSDATRQRLETARALAGGINGGAPVAANQAWWSIGADAARRFMAEFNLTPQQAAGVVAAALHGALPGRTTDTPGMAGDGRSGRSGRARRRRQRLIDFALLQGLDPQTPDAACALAANELRGEFAACLPVLRRAGSAEQAMEAFLREIDGDAGPLDGDDRHAVAAILHRLDESLPGTV